MFGLGAQELIILLVIVLVLFGSTKLPMLGKGLGGFITNFKAGIKEGDEESKKKEEIEVVEEDKKES